MKYGIDIGHNAPPDTGASGIRQEDQLTREVGTRVISKLRALGNTVVDCTPARAFSVTNSLYQRINAANVNRVDAFVSIHFNAFNGRAYGTEVFAISAAGRRMGQPVVDRIAALGFFKRGLKNGAHLYVLRNTIAPAILVECCFCDSALDMSLYNPDSMSDAIVQGLTGRLPSPSPSPAPAPAPSPSPSPGGSSSEVLKLQKTLNRLKIPDDNWQPLVEDGIMGPATRAATRRCQRILGLLDDGIAGPRTWRNINQVLAKPILRPNMASGPAVRYVQYRVGADIDGIFGSLTQGLVQRYQSEQGLTVDGIVGPQTWTSLIG